MFVIKNHSKQKQIKLKTPPNWSAFTIKVVKTGYIREGFQLIKNLF